MTQKLIYNKHTLAIVGNISQGRTLDQELALNVYGNFKGVKSDYDTIETNLENVELKRTDNRVEVVKKAPPVVEPQPPKPPSPTEQLSDYIVDVDFRVTMIELGL
ncbi:hypothetical protein [Paenisporosarcina sp. NPDC076898]|uniref:hypothetical protein n=1 Tax=unclassified Paenisporosarcina TaxID=2642018 RepID=UPI003D05C350